MGEKTERVPGRVLTWEEQEENMDLLGQAAVDSNREEMDRLMQLVQFEAGSLAACKKLLGADYIREKNLDTTLADIRYGPGWLDRPDEEL